MSLEGNTPGEETGIKYDFKNWTDIIGYEKKPIVHS
jgi:hypothetical protein